MSTAFLLFTKFLVEHNALADYYTNMVEDFTADEVAYTIGLRIEQMQTIANASVFLMGAFRFDSTYEGFDYWYELNSEWETYAKSEGLM